MEYKDYYKTLGVERSASEDEIKKAYRRLARTYHPDVSKEKDAEARFKEVTEAYEDLKDKDKRASYDQLGSNWQQGQDFRPPPGWENMGGGFSGGFRGAGPGAGGAGFSDFFESIFGGAGAGFSGRGAGASYARPRKGADATGKIDVTLEEAHKGSSRTISLSSGKQVKVRIPAGVNEGQKIRLAGQGASGANGGPNGDLFLEIHILPHKRFRLDGQSVYLDLPVAPWEAAFGAKIKVPTLDGDIEVSIPKGSQSGRKLRLKGRGVHGKGDFFVVVQIHLPPAEDSVAVTRAYEEMQESGFNPRANW